MYLERFRLDGELAVVTGGGRGIGLASADALGEAGARLAIIERDPALLEEAHAILQAKGYDVSVHEGDVTDPARMQAIADELTVKGGASILVNNAGIALSDIPAEDMEDERWLKVIDVNLNGVYWCSRAFGRHMLSAGRGSIVNVGSMSGFIVNRPQPQAHYNACDLVVLAHARHGRGIEPAVEHGPVVLDERVERRFDVGGRDRVDPHATRRPFGGERLGQVVYGGLRGARQPAKSSNVSASTSTPPSTPDA